MSKMQRTKGAAGEREVRALLVEQLGEKMVSRRRLSQYQTPGEHDLTVADYAIEVKRHATATRGKIEAWYREAECQAGNRKPALAYRQDRDEWRFVVPYGIIGGYEWTHEMSLLGFCLMVRESEAARCMNELASSTSKRAVLRGCADR